MTGNDVNDVDSGAPGASSTDAFPRLFAPYRMRGVEIPNRIVFAGHGSRFIDPHTHSLTRRQADYLAERARGGAGLIIQGSGIVHPTGMTFGGINQAWNDEGIASYAEVVDAVHAFDTPIFAQLSHLGRQGSGFPAHRELWAPSAIADPSSRVVPHAMTRRDIQELVESYRSAAMRMRSAGFDGLEVYFAHGYLLCSFLSRFSNARTDEYGGSLENRMRLPLEVFRAVSEAVGDAVPVGVRISADEFVPNGLDLDEAQEIVRLLCASVRVDYLSVSQSNYASIDRQIPDMSFPIAPFVHLARGIRQGANGVPVFAVARIVSAQKGEELLREGAADIICLVRPLIADPQLPEKARTGRVLEIRPCISCNVGCRGGPHRGLPISCLVNPVVGFEREWGIGKVGPTDDPRHVLVVGGGPAGLKAAETAARRGHRVTLFESRDQLGGQVLIAAAAMPYRDEFAGSTRFLAGEVARLGVDVRTGVTADVAAIEDLDPDVVVVATGSLPGRPEVPGARMAHVVSCQDAIVGPEIRGRRVAVIDCGEADWKSLTTAERLLSLGNDVVLVTPVQAGAEIDAFSRPPLMRRLMGAGLELRESHRLVAITERDVVIAQTWTGGEEILRDVDVVVLAWYGVADDLLARELESSGRDVRVVGDALAPRRAIDAIWDGFRIGIAL